MGSVATTRGDNGQTGLAGGIRVSKASPRVDAYGNVDELISTLGFARSICDDADIVELVRGVQRELFQIGSSLATLPESVKPRVRVDAATVERLTAEVHRLEAIDGMLSDWSVSGALPLRRRSTWRVRSAAARSVASSVSLRPASPWSRTSSPTSTACRICCGSSAASSNTMRV